MRTCEIGGTPPEYRMAIAWTESDPVTAPVSTVADVKVWLRYALERAAAGVYFQDPATGSLWELVPSLDAPPELLWTVGDGGAARWQVTRRGYRWQSIDEAPWIEGISVDVVFAGDLLHGIPGETLSSRLMQEALAGRELQVTVPATAEADLKVWLESWWLGPVSPFPVASEVQRSTYRQEIVVPWVTDAADDEAPPGTVESGPAVTEIETYSAECLGSLAVWSLTDGSIRRQLALLWYDGLYPGQVPSVWFGTAPGYLQYVPPPTGGETVDLTALIAKLEEMRLELEAIAQKETRLSVNRGAVVVTMESGDVTEGQ